jgi:ribosome maturation factor RimP
MDQGRGDRLVVPRKQLRLAGASVSECLGIRNDYRCRGRRLALLAAGHQGDGDEPQDGSTRHDAGLHWPESAIWSRRLDYGGGMPALSQSRLREIVGPAVEASGYDLEEVTMSKAGRRSVVKVVVDRDGGVDLDAVADVSRAVSSALDEADPLGEQAYVLEVTSPGVDRPLTEPRHWRRNIGRLAKTGEVTGRIREVTDDGVSIEVNGEVETISFPDLGEGRVVLEFTRGDAS